MFYKMNRNIKQRVKTASIIGVIIAGITCGTLLTHKLISNLPHNNYPQTEETTGENEQTSPETTYFIPETTSSQTNNFPTDTTKTETTATNGSGTINFNPYPDTSTPNPYETSPTNTGIGIGNGNVGVGSKDDPSSHTPNP